MKSVRAPFLLFAVPAALAGLAPAVFVYDRAAILRGEAWRIVTGHWVHFSAPHAAWNLLVLLVAGTWLERVRPGALLRCTLFAAPVIGFGLLGCAPTMAFFGGLSGLAVGVVVLLALTQLSEAPAARVAWIAALALVAAKILWESTGGAALFSDFGAAAIRPSGAAHAWGAATAVACSVASRIAASCRRPAPRNV